MLILLGLQFYFQIGTSFSGEKMYFTRISSMTLLFFLMLSEVCFVRGGHAAQGKVQENRKRLIETNSCPGCDLSGADLNRANLPGANLQGANLAYAQLHLATLTKANLQNAILKNTELNGANLADADLRGADLRGTNFTDAYLVGIKFDRKKLLDSPSEQAVAESASPVTPAVSAVAGKDGNSAPDEKNGFLRRTWGGMMGLIFGSDASEEQAMDIEKKDLSQKLENPGVNVETEKSNTTNVVALGKVSSPVASPVVVDEELVVEPDEDDVVEEAKGAILSTKELVSEKKTSVVVASPKEKAVFDTTAEIEKNKLRLLETKKCYDCNLAGVDLTGKNLSGADLEGADLTGSKLAEANLENANLKGAILVRADLRNAKLQKADLYKANLSKADLSGAKLEGALLEDAQVSDTMGYK